MWYTLNTEYGGSDASIELYIIEQYYDYQMIDVKNMVTHTHEIHTVHNEGTRTLSFSINL
jgi:hypothetical protein